MKHTLLILVDALRHDYFEDMPYLRSLQKTSIYGSVIPPFGFEPDGAYFTGKYPEEYLGGMHFIRNNDDSKQKKLLKLFPSFLDKLNPMIQFPIRRTLKVLLSKLGETRRLKKNASYFNIPFSLMEYFIPGDDKFPHEYGFGNNSFTIFDYLRREKKTFYYHGALEYDCHAEMVWKHLKNNFRNDLSFTFLFISDLDYIGHKYGPNSYQRKQKCRDIDKIIKQIIKFVRSVYSEVDLIIFGDHGMVDVRHTVNVTDVLERMRLKIKKDYIYFLDSTFVRFWVNNKSTEAKIKMKFGQIKGLKLVDDDLREQYKINYPDNRYGDLIYWTEGGYIVYPNFWSFNKVPKGMHGYPDDVKDNHSAFLFNSSDINTCGKVSPITMVDIFQTTMYSLGLTPAPDTHGLALQKRIRSQKLN